MSKDFVKGWAKERKTPVTIGVKEKLYPAPLRERITKTSFRLKMAQRKLEQLGNRMEHKDKELFKKCVRAHERKDPAIATMYANECAQIRKIAQTIISSQLALEQVVLRLETVQDFGDAAVVLAPAATIVRSIKDRVSGVIPQVSYSLGEISETLDGLVMEVGEVTGVTLDVTASEEAEKILTEAGTISEQKMKELFPALPTVAAPERGVGTEGGTSRP